MSENRRGDNKSRRKITGTVRASASYPRELYRVLEAIAKEKKVSVAWVIRDASEKYVNERWPLFSASKSGT